MKIKHKSRDNSKLTENLLSEVKTVVPWLKITTSSRRTQDIWRGNITTIVKFLSSHPSWNYCHHHYHQIIVITTIIILLSSQLSSNHCHHRKIPVLHGQAAEESRSQSSPCCYICPEKVKVVRFVPKKVRVFVLRKWKFLHLRKWKLL